MSIFSNTILKIVSKKLDIDFKKKGIYQMILRHILHYEQYKYSKYIKMYIFSNAILKSFS